MGARRGSPIAIGMATVKCFWLGPPWHRTNDLPHNLSRGSARLGGITSNAVTIFDADNAESAPDREIGRVLARSSAREFTAIHANGDLRNNPQSRRYVMR